MIHFHGTPISPITALLEMGGRNFCISHQAPQDVERAHQIGQQVMLDNGAFSKWKSGKATDWPAYYEWCDKWLDYPTTWAIIPDVIDAGAQLQDALIKEWPHGGKGAPVWHMDEPISRLIDLCENWQRVCVGSTEEYAVVMSDVWQRRMDETWNEVDRVYKRVPYLHMLRGMQLSGMRWPFASVDSTDIGRNHNRDQNTPRKMADRWDRMQTPRNWVQRPHQERMFG